VRNLLGLFIAIVAAPFFAVPVGAGTIRTAVVHMGVDDSGSVGVSNVINYLDGDARFSAVGNVKVDGTIPDLASLRGYDSVLVVTDNNGTFSEATRTALGDRLAEYLDGGGRVVMTGFGADPNIGVLGSVLDRAPYEIDGTNTPGGGIDSTTTVDSHFAFLRGDMNSPFTFSSSEPATAIQTSSRGIVLAEYVGSDLPLVLTTQGDAFMYINAFPGTAADYSNGTMFGQLFANSLAGGNGVVAVPEPTSLTISAIAIGTAIVYRRGKRLQQKRQSI
jgi:hypothetical protein